MMAYQIMRNCAWRISEEIKLCLKNSTLLRYSLQSTVSLRNNQTIKCADKKSQHVGSFMLTL